MKTDSPTTAAAAIINLDACQDRFFELTGSIAERFPRVEPRRHATAFLRALMAGLPRANCWTLAEHAGYRSPDTFQYLLAQSVWDHDGVRDDLRTFVVDHLGRDGAVLVLDETGDLKKGVHTAGVQRQYTGTAGRIENAQVAVYAVWAGWRSAAFVDRELYVPRPWTADPARCAAAGLPADLAFATKPAQALRIMQRTVAAGAMPGFVAGDEVDDVATSLLERPAYQWTKISTMSTTVNVLLAIGCPSAHTTAGSRGTTTGERRGHARPDGAATHRDDDQGAKAMTKL